MKCVARILLCIVLATIACTSGAPSTVTTTPIEAPATEAATEPVAPDPTTAVATATTGYARESPYLRDFERVWNAVNTRYFDPSFGGVDWQGMHDHYEPLIAAAADDEAFYTLINQMLFQLEVSHLAVVPHGAWALVEPVISAPGEIGIDVRLLDGEAVITGVEPGSAGEKAGLRPGLAIQSIDGLPIDEIIDEAALNLAPPYNSRARVDNITRAILALIYGDPETAVSIGYADESGKTQTAHLLRTARERKRSDFGFPVFLEFEQRRLDDGIGYVRFNSFHQDLTAELVGAIESMREAPGIIIDLRGNPGGDPRVGAALAGQFMRERAPFWTTRSRDRTGTIHINPVEKPYDGPVVVLIDATSTSGSEIFAAAMQAVGRGLIVGEHSSGNCLAADLERLSTGASFIYPIVQAIAPDGTVIEGNGVTPDIEVALDRVLLLQGRDSQLEAAIEYIQKETKGRSP
jgi:carboxyl-terminal processing protease